MIFPHINSKVFDNAVLKSHFSLSKTHKRNAQNTLVRICSVQSDREPHSGLKS